ncbi:hypothetical protein D3Z58_22645 [Clostridiaceae bacterium]|nr:hypothetical protein [Clostridiaceae bacterium]
MNHRLMTLLILIFILCNWLNHCNRLDEEIERRAAEINRINTYFEGTYEVYKILPWVELAPARSKVNAIYHINYLLQTKEQHTKTEENPYVPMGMPYYPFHSRRKAVNCYNKLTEQEKSQYLVISNSIVYIGYADDDAKEILREAVKHFDSEQLFEIPPYLELLIGKEGYFWKIL